MLKKIYIKIVGKRRGMEQINDVLVSIIVPVYNVEEYLGTCLDSLLQQTHRELEIILIDDGSTDCSGKICDEYADKDDRIRVIHQKNCGVSTARNVALDMFTGQFVAFVDADDYVDRDFISELLIAMIQEKSDLAICGYEKIGGIQLNKNQLSDFKNQTFVMEELRNVDRDTVFYHTICTNMIGAYLCNKLFKASIIQDMRFSPELTIGEDMVFVTQYEMRCTTYTYIAKALYKYRMNQNSAMGAINYLQGNPYKNRGKWESALEAVKQVRTNMNNQAEYIKDCVAYRQLRSSLWVMFRMILDEYYDVEIAKQLKQNYKDAYKGYRRIHYGSRIQHLAIKIMGMNPQLVYIVGVQFKKLFPQVLYKVSRQ